MERPDIFFPMDSPDLDRAGERDHQNDLRERQREAAKEMEGDWTWTCPGMQRRAARIRARVAAFTRSVTGRDK